MFASKDAPIQVALCLIRCKSCLYRVLAFVFQSKTNRCAWACDEGLWGTGDIIVLVLNLCDRWDWSLLYPLNMTPGSQSQSRRSGEDINRILLSVTNKMQRHTIFFIIVNALHVSGSFSAHHQELKNCTHSIGYMSSLLAATDSMGEFSPMLCLQFLSSWWWAEKLPETFRALTVIKNIVRRLEL